MSEQTLQRKILTWLENAGFWAFKVITCNKKGIMDIIACSPLGRFVGIEVKFGKNKATALQNHHIKEVQKRGGIAFIAYDLETVAYKLTPHARSNYE